MKSRVKPCDPRPGNGHPGIIISRLFIEPVGEHIECLQLNIHSTDPENTDFQIEIKSDLHDGKSKSHRKELIKFFQVKSKVVIYSNGHDDYRIRALGSDKGFLIFRGSRVWRENQVKK